MGSKPILSQACVSCWYNDSIDCGCTMAFMAPLLTCTWLPAQYKRRHSFDLLPTHFTPSTSNFHSSYNLSYSNLSINPWNTNYIQPQHNMHCNNYNNSPSSTLPAQPPAVSQAPPTPTPSKWSATACPFLLFIIWLSNSIEQYALFFFL